MTHIFIWATRANLRGLVWDIKCHTGDLSMCSLEHINYSAHSTQTASMHSVCTRRGSSRAPWTLKYDVRRRPTFFPHHTRSHAMRTTDGRRVACGVLAYLLFQGRIGHSITAEQLGGDGVVRSARVRRVRATINYPRR